MAPISKHTKGHPQNEWKRMGIQYKLENARQFLGSGAKMSPNVREKIQAEIRELEAELDRL